MLNLRQENELKFEEINNIEEMSIQSILKFILNLNEIQFTPIYNSFIAWMHESWEDISYTS